MARPLPGLDVPVVDPQTRQMLQVWYAYFQALTADVQALAADVADIADAVDAARVPLTSDAAIYVRTDGLATEAIDPAEIADTAAGAFPTWQAAYDYFCKRVDTQGYTVYLAKGSGGSGTFSAGLVIGYPTWVGGGQLVIYGGGSASCAISTTGTCIYLQGVLGGFVTIAGIKLTSSAGEAIRHVAVGTINIEADVDFGACASSHIEAHNTGAVVNILVVSYKISGGAYTHMWSHSGGAIYHEYATPTLSGTPAFTAFAIAVTNGVVQSIGSVFSGTGATGPRYYASTGGQIFTNGGGATYFPGSVAGSADAATFGSYS